MYQAGEKNVNAKLKDREILEIRDLYDLGVFAQKEIAYYYGISQRNINCIVNRKTWRHL